MALGSEGIILQILGCCGAGGVQKLWPCVDEMREVRAVTQVAWCSVTVCGRPPPFLVMQRGNTKLVLM